MNSQLEGLASGRCPHGLYVGLSNFRCKDCEIAALSARLAEAEATNRHRDRQIAAIVTWLEQNQLDVFRRGLWDVIPRATDSAGEKP